MAIIALKAWYLEQYEPIRQVIQRSPDLRLSRNSLLKSGLRADFLDERQQVHDSQWFKRYLEGELVEFYIEGSGGYQIANIDLISQEIYFTKQDLTANLDPIIYLSSQAQYPQSSEILQAVLGEVIEAFNQRSRLSLSLEITPLAKESPLRLSDSQLRKIRKSLLFIADGTAITQIESEYIFNSPVCVALGYAMGYKSSGQILLVYQQRPELGGEVPFDLPQHQQLGFTSKDNLRQVLPQVIETLLQRFNLTSS
jgi:hypothetical protein